MEALLPGAEPAGLGAWEPDASPPTLAPPPAVPALSSPALADAGCTERENVHTQFQGRL